MKTCEICGREHVEMSKEAKDMMKRVLGRNGMCLRCYSDEMKKRRGRRGVKNYKEIS